MEVAVPEEPQKKVFRARKTMKARDRPQLEVLHNTLLTVSANTATPPSSSPSSSTSSTIPASMVNGTHSDDGVKATAKSKEPGKEKTKEKEKTATVNGPSSNSPAPATPASGSASPHLGLSLSRSPSPSTQSLKPSAAVTKNGERRMGEKTEEEMEVDTDMDKEKGNEKKEEEEGETESKKNEGKASRSSSPTELASAAATDATSSRKKRPPSPDREKSEEKAGEATTEEERGGKRLRVEGLELEVEAQIELKITEGAADSRLKIEKVVQKLVEERLRVLELTVFDRTLQELKERVEKIDCATKHQGTLNTLQARIARLVKKFGAANQASENSRKVQENGKMAATMSSSSSTDNEESIYKSLEKSKLSKHKHCYMHIASVKHQEVNDFTTTRWNTFKTCLQQWLGLKGESRDVAETYKHCLDVDFENIPEDAGFHHTCYCRFTDKKAIAKVERRLAREVELTEVTEDHNAFEAIPSTSTSSMVQSPSKKLRSRSGLPIAGSGPVLPALCIICKKKEKLINKAGKRQRDPLSKAETLTAGQLQKAAELKEDESILIHIKDKDCVALEVQYHKGCYNRYTRFLTRPAKPENEQNEQIFDVRYKIFCEKIIRQRLLINQSTDRIR
ncbi:uncharacterized protein LOC143126355 isoform X3 [Alosa pseudoharengus]|uniref:uncharacterized protein LOC143126355 isoform X3 n=1 Tax=Alosa pseudoharengus TaxID=34774 RepID=UPI003F899F31